MTDRVNPYVGLVPYTEADAEWFFGRDHEISLIAANLRASPLTLLYGASGAGKTSLLMAGVLPQLRRLVADERAARTRPDGSAVVLAERAPFAVAVFREWRDAPLGPLTESIRAAAAEALESEVVEPWRAGDSLHDWLSEVSRHIRTVLVVLDQFEEYLMYHPDEDGPGTFAGELPAAVNDPDLRVNFLISLREDAWSKLDRFKGRIPELFANYLRVDHLDRAAARGAIVQPLAHANDLRAPDAAPVTIQPELVETVLNDVRAGRLALADTPTPALDPSVVAGAGDRVETPYLQLVMARLWTAGTGDGRRELTLRTLAELGGASAIVSSHLKEAMAGLSTADRAIAADVFAFLVSPSKTKIAHSASDLAFWTRREPRSVGRVLDALADSDRRILRRVPPAGEAEVDRYEIFHDVLADAVLEWSSREQEQRRRAALRRRWLLRALVALVALGALTGGIIRVVHNASSASQETHKLERQRSALQLQRDEERANGLAFSSAAQLTVDPERSLLLALEAVHTPHRTEAAANALRNAVAASQLRAAYLSGAPRPCPRECRVRAHRAPRGVPATLDATASSAVAVAAPLAPGGDFAGVPPDRVESVSPDGRTIALVRHGAIKRWSPTTGAVRTVRGVRGAAQLEFLGDGSRLLVVTTRGAAVVVGVNGARATRTVGRGVSLAAASRNGRYVATVRGRALTVTRTSDGRRWRRRLRHSPSAVEFDPVNAQILFLAFPSRRPRPFRMRWQRPALIGPRRVAGVDQQAACYVFSDVNPSAISADGRLLAVVDVCGGPRVYDTGSGRLVFSMPADAQPVSSMQFDPSGTRLLTVKRNVATIWALPPEPKEAAITLGGHTDVIDAATFSPDGRLVATASNDGSARVWDAGTGAQLAELRGLGIGGRSSGITAAQFSPDSRLVATVDEDGVARLWNGATPGRRLPLRRYDQVAAAGFAGDSRDVVFVTQAGRVGRWRPGAGRPKPRIKFHGFVFDASVAEDAPRVLIAGAIETSRRGRFRSVAELGDLDRRRFRRIAGGVSLPLSVAAAGDRVLTRDRIWRVAGGKWGPRLLPGREWRNLTFAGFARDGRMLFATNGGRAQIVDSHGHTIVHLRDRNRALSSRIYGGSFDRAGDRVVTWGAREAVIWDAGTGHVLRRLSGHRGVVAGADFSGDGSRVVTAGADRTIRVWDARTGDQLAVLAQVPGQPTSVAFDRSGQDVLAVSANFEGDGTARLIRCLPCRPIGKLIATAEHRVTRALTPAERTTFVRLPRQR